MQNLTNATLYLFKEEFFDDLNFVKSLINSFQSEVNKCNSQEEKNTLLLVKSFIISDLIKRTNNAIVKDYFLLAEANFLQTVAYSQGNRDLYIKAIKRIKEVDTNHSDLLLKNAYYLIKGEIFLRFHLNIRKNAPESKETIRSYKYLFEAKKCFSVLMNKYFSGEIDIKVNNPQKAILGFCETISHLSRFVEPFYFLEELLKFSDKRSGSVALLRYSLLEAIKEKTCDSTNPLLLLQLDNRIDEAIISNQIDERNFPLLNERKLEINEILIGYEKEHNVNKKKLDEILHKGIQQIEKYNHYKKFLLSNHLLLNEHSLYCSCKASIKDNLKIEAGCEHTKHSKNLPFELILDKLKAEFDNSRQAYFRSASSEGKKKSYQNTIVTSNKVPGLLINTESANLISSFGKCFSILDKIAVGVNQAYQIITDQKEISRINFTYFFNRKAVKKVIDNESNNLFLIAMYSLSQDLNNESEFSEFSEFKSWRNAIEHDQFYLVDKSCDLYNLKQLFPEARFFIEQEEFKKKTLYLLQFTKSAIFTFAWLLRKKSIIWFNENEIQNGSQQSGERSCHREIKDEN